MAARKLDYSNTTPRRVCTIRTPQPFVDAVGEFSTVSDDPSTTTLTTKDPAARIVIRHIYDRHPSFDAFFAAEPVIYLYPESTVPEPVSGAAVPKRRIDVVVATGETTLFTSLAAFLGDRVAMKPLAFGDVWFMCGDERVDVVIERKAAEDFVASKLDGRLDTQSDVMVKNTTRPGLVFHCIEGDILATRPRQRFNDKAILGSLIYPIMRKNTSACIVTSVQGTAAFVRNIHALLEHADEAKFRDKAMPPPARGMNTTVRKKDVTEQNQVYAQLANIREIGEVFAAAIVKRYPTFAEIFREYLARGELALSDTPTQSGKVGDRVSKRIYEVYRPDLFMAPRGAKRIKINEDEDVE